MITFDRKWYIQNILCRHISDDKIYEEILDTYNNDHWNKVVEYIFELTHNKVNSKDPTISLVGHQVAKRIKNEKV